MFKLYKAQSVSHNYAYILFEKRYKFLNCKPQKESYFISIGV